MYQVLPITIYQPHMEKPAIKAMTSLKRSFQSLSFTRADTDMT